jgi:C4-dicarboxylate-specific signal transduction histidine kinase
LDDIEQQYVRMNEILLKSSNMGLSFGIVVHEVDKRLSRLKKSVELPEVDIDNLRSQIESISGIVRSYAAIASTDIKRTSIKKAVDVALMNVEFRFIAHKVTLVRQFDNNKDVTAKLSLNSIVGVMINIFDNSIYWLNKYEIKTPKMFVSLKEYESEVGIIIADNGKGFMIPFDDALKPFVTEKVIGGQGLGLHIADETMRMHGGKIVQRNFDEVDNLPNEFSDGAIIELIFKKEK